MPQFDPSSFASQLFWLVVTFTLLYLALWKMILPRIGGALETRQRKIDDDLDRATAAKQEADEVLAAYEKTMAGGTAKAQSLLRETAEEAAGKAADRHGELAQTLASQVEEAEAGIEQAKSAASANIDQVAAEVAQSAIRRLLGDSVDEAAAKSAVAAVSQGNA